MKYWTNEDEWEDRLLYEFNRCWDEYDDFEMEAAARAVREKEVAEAIRDEMSSARVELIRTVGAFSQTDAWASHSFEGNPHERILYGFKSYVAVKCKSCGMRILFVAGYMYVAMGDDSPVYTSWDKVRSCFDVSQGVLEEVMVS